MKMTIRQGVFETNSSSSHAVTITTLETYNRWQNDEVFIRLEGGVDYEFVEKETISKEFQKEFQKLTKEEQDRYYDFEDFLEQKLFNLNLQSFNQYECEESHGISFIHHFTTPSGDKMVVFGDGPEDY